MSRYGASVRAAQACKALHAARRKAVEQRVNEALDDSSNSGEAEASRRFTARVLLALRLCPRRVRRSTDTTNRFGAVVISRVLQPGRKERAPGPYGLKPQPTLGASRTRSVRGARRFT